MTNLLIYCIIVNMKTAARLQIVTHRNTRETIETDGFIERNGSTEFGWDGDGYSMRVNLCDGCATVTRLGADGYVMRLTEGTFTEFEAAGLRTEVYTIKLLAKVTANRTDFCATYYIGSPENTAKIIIKVFHPVRQANLS